MFNKWIDLVYSGCVNDWHYALCLLLLLLFFDVICQLIDTFGKGAKP